VIAVQGTEAKFKLAEVIAEQYTEAESAEVMAEQCTEAELADQFQASVIGFSRSNGVVGNMPTVLSRGDVCLNLCDLDTGQTKSSSYGAGASHAQVMQVRSNVEHGRVVECAQHSHFKSDRTGRACEVSRMGAVEILKSTKSASNYLIVGSTAECPILDGQSNAEQSLSFFKPNGAVLSRQSSVLSHQNGQGDGRDSVAASSCASAIFCGTVALLSASTVVPMMEQLQGGRIKRDWSQYLVNQSKGGRTKHVWSQYFVNWSKGGRVRPRSSYDARHQTLQCTSQIEYCAVLSQMRGFEYCKELMRTMNLELGRVSEVEVSRASSIGTRLRRFTLFAMF
jgi:hypothetical protein